VSEAPRLPLRAIAASTVIALAAALAVYAVLDDGGDGDAAPPADTIELTPADEAPDDPDSVTFTTFDDEVVSLASLRGSPVLVNFFASTCVPCVEEMPALEEVHQQVGDQVAFLGLAMQDRPEAALDLIERTGVSYPTAQDKDASVITALGGTVLPTTVLLDAAGEVVAIHNGELDAGELRQLLADELGITL
jgi:cytochrome c biogenesis protein CcmG/thiol:disulfide interchange protein DsbE